MSLISLTPEQLAEHPITDGQVLTPNDLRDFGFDPESILGPGADQAPGDQPFEPAGGAGVLPQLGNAISNALPSSWQVNGLVIAAVIAVLAIAYIVHKVL